jgi:hypothetical protein
MNASQARAWRDRWQAVAARESHEHQQASFATRWQQFQAVMRLGRGLHLSRFSSIFKEAEERETAEVRQRWQKLKGGDLLPADERFPPDERDLRMIPDEVTALLAPLAAVQRVLFHFHNQGMVIGGVATSLLGKPRLTADVDVLLFLSMDMLPELVEVATREGLVPRFADAEAFARQSRVLLLVHQESGLPVDISLGALPFEAEAVERSTVYREGSVTIRIPTPEDLIILKSVAHRPKDLTDIQALIECSPNLDRARIRGWVAQFAEVLDMPALWDDIAAWLEEPES